MALSIASDAESKEDPAASRVRTYPNSCGPKVAVNSWDRGDCTPCDMDEGLIVVGTLGYSTRGPSLFLFLLSPFFGWFARSQKPDGRSDGGATMGHVYTGRHVYTRRAVAPTRVRETGRPVSRRGHEVPRIHQGPRIQTRRAVASESHQGSGIRHKTLE